MKEQLKKIIDFCKRFKNHKVINFYNQYLSVDLYSISESELMKLTENDRLKQMLSHISFMIDDQFMDCITPTEVEDMFLALEDNNVEITADYNFESKFYSISVTKKTHKPVKEIATISTELLKVEERCVAKGVKLIFKSQETKTWNKESTIKFTLIISKHPYKESTANTDKPIADAWEKLKKTVTDKIEDYGYNDIITRSSMEYIIDQYCNRPSKYLDL